MLENYDFNPLNNPVASPKPLLALTLAAIALYTLHQWLLPNPLPGIAYNDKAAKSLFGDAPDMLRYISITGEFGVWCAEQVRKMNSPVCQVFVRPFSKPWIFLADFREARDILTMRKDFDKSTFVIDGMGCLGHFHAAFKTTKAFKANRQLLQDLMTPSYLNNVMGPVMHAKGLEVVDLFEKKMRLANGRPFNVKGDFDWASLDVVVHFAFGRNIASTAIGPQLEFYSQLNPSQIQLGDPDEPVSLPEAPVDEFLVTVHEAPHVVEKTIVSWIPRLSLWWWKKMSWYKKIFSSKHRTVSEQISKAMSNYRAGEIRSGMEHILMREEIAAEKEGRSPDFDSPNLVDEMFGNMVAGHHTTGGALGWMTKYLTGYPHVQSKLRSALYAAIPKAVEENRFPTFEEIRTARIPYLEAVIDEMLRLTAVTVTREATCDTEILGRRIPKGTQVFLVSNGPGFLYPSFNIDDASRSATSKATRGEKWDETDDLRVFDPERWLVYKDGGGVDFDGAAGPQLGWGLGTRQCWGRRLAHMEVRTIMSLLVWNFEMLEIPEKLGGYAGFDGISRRPQKVFVRLRKVER